MRRHRSAALLLAFGLCLACAAQRTEAAESGFNIYPLGSLAFGAGHTPPPGFYVTNVLGYYEGSIGGNVNIGRVVAVDLHAKFLNAATNFLYVPPNTTFLGGQPGFSVTVPVGYLDFAAQATIGPLTATRQVAGGGLGDIMARVQLGWTHGPFAHTFYLSGWLPTGRYEPTFAPNIGLNRPAVDATWGFTYTEPTTMFELSGAVGLTANARNTATDYLTGLESHFEWSLAKKFGHQLTIGIGGYHYRQLTGDSGSGATFAPFISRNNGIGPGLSYVTQIAGHVAIFALSHYWEYEAVRHFEGTVSTASVTIRY
jgi:hypothetical protein